MDELLTLSALDLSARLASREVSAREVMRAALDRIAAVNGTVNAIVALRDADALMAEAEAADQAGRKGWLHGIPFAVKDLVATAGVVTSWGSPSFAGHVPDHDDLLARKLKAAGAIVIGKTNVPEMGLGSHSYNPIYGVTRNPYDPSVTAGGSSGGAGAALAARMVWVADGSDAMGSLRNPAVWNNVYGHRPSLGLVADSSQRDLYLHHIVTLGPMARTPRDLAALLETMSGRDAGYPWGGDFVAGDLDTEVRGRRIGWLGDWGGAWPMERGLLDLGRAALRVFEQLGCTVEEVAPPFDANRLWTAWLRLRHFAVAAKGAAIYGDPVERAKMKPAFRWEVEQGRALTAEQILEASEIRSDWFRAAAALFERFDAVMLPATQVWPFPVDLDWPKKIAGVAMDTYHRWMSCVIPVSLLGLPATALPAGFGDSGLPGGVQIAGPMRSDAALLQLAQAYHRATGWTERLPPL